MAHSTFVCNTNAENAVRQFVVARSATNSVLRYFMPQFVVAVISFIYACFCCCFFAFASVLLLLPQFMRIWRKPLGHWLDHSQLPFSHASGRSVARLVDRPIGQCDVGSGAGWRTSSSAKSVISIWLSACIVGQQQCGCVCLYFFFFVALSCFAVFGFWISTFRAC